MNGRVPYAAVSHNMMTFIFKNTYRMMSRGFTLMLPTNSGISLNEKPVASL